MAGFGGTVKLTGESEYRQAIQKITQDLQNMSTALKNQTATLNANDKSVSATAAKQKELNEALKSQQSALSQAKTAYAEYAVAVQAQTTRHNALTREYKNAVTELDKIGKASGTTSNEYKKQAEVVDKLGSELAESTAEINESKSAMSALKSEINSSTKIIANTTKEINDLGNETEDAGKQAADATDNGFTVLKGALANLVSQGITAALNGVKKLGSAVVDLGKQAVANYANYEQLVGGVETLFKESAGVVEEYANIAYKTAGLSANEYMETVTSFSASLLQSLGQDTAKSAEYADRAIVDMADNANKMGTQIGMIQNAYQGFAKQNYTMLDNLKLGYGGTKTEMERLIKDANKVKEANGEMANLTIESFADVTEAIHIIQTELGITGTTAQEASDTISGSAGSMKAAWQNLLTAIADKNQDTSKSVNEFVDSVVGASKNLVPRVKVVVDGIKQLINSIITEVFPKLKKEIPELAPLISTFEWFIDNRSLVVGAITAMVAAFAINKIVDFTKSLSDGVKRLMEIATSTTAATAATTANTAAAAANTAATAANTAVQVTATTTTGALTAATNLLNAAWKANPIGLVVAGVTAAIGVFSLFKSKTDEATEAQKAQTEAINKQLEAVNESKKAWDDLIAAQQEQIDTSMTEMAHYESLYDELGQIVDQNGRVKDGYEERASFITSTLSDALGVEIKTVDGVIQKYSDLTAKIDEVIEKKKAQIILDSQETLYKEAIAGQAEAAKQLAETEQQLNDRKAERAKLYDELQAKEQAWQEAVDRGMIDMSEAAIKQALVAEEKLKQYDAETAKIQQTYDKQEDLFNSYAYNMGVYESNLAAVHAGNYDEMIKVTWNAQKEYQSAGDAEKARLEDQIKTTETTVARLKELKEQSGQDIYDQQIKDGEKQLEELRKNLKQYVSTTDKELDKATIVWRDDLGKQLSEITGAKVEFKEDGKGNVTAYIDGVASGEKKSKEEMASLVTETIKEISNQKTGAETAGNDLIDGVNNGIANERKQSGVFSTIANFGATLLSKLKASLKEKSPSQATNEMGQYLLEGLELGVESQESTTLKKVAEFGSELLQAVTPSKVAATNIGKNIALEVIDGVKSQQANATKSAEELSKAYVTAAQSKVTALKSANELSTEQEIEFWTAMLETVQQGTTQYDTVYTKLNTAKNKLVEDTLKSTETLTSDTAKLTKEFAESVTKIEQDTSKAIDKLWDDYHTSVQKRQESIMSSLKLFDDVDVDDAIAKDQLLQNLRDQVTTLKEWDQVLDNLRKRIKNEDLLEYLEVQGVKSIEQLKTINGFSDDELKQYEALFERKQKIALNRAKDEHAMLKETTKKQIEDLKTQATTQIDELKNTYVAKLNELAISGRDQGVNVGSAIASGMQSGLETGLDKVETYLVRRVREMTEAVEEELDINSPSGVYRDQIGKQMAAGLGEGFAVEMSTVVRDMQQAIPTNLDLPRNSVSTATATSDSYFANMVDAFKVALSQMTVEMDDEIMGKFVTKTVARAIYT